MLAQATSLAEDTRSRTVTGRPRVVGCRPVSVVAQRRAGRSLPRSLEPRDLVLADCGIRWTHECRDAKSSGTARLQLGETRPDSVVERSLNVAGDDRVAFATHVRRLYRQAGPGPDQHGAQIERVGGRDPVPIVLGASVVGLVALVVVAASHTADAASSPLKPDGNWKAVLVVAAIAGFAVYIGLLLALRRGAHSTVPILALVAIVQVAAVAGPTLLSRDVYTYWAYGRVEAVHDANAYEDVPGRWPYDPATVAMGSSWREQPSLYGPAFTALSAVVARAAGDSPRRASTLFRSLAALSILAIASLAALLATNRAFAVAFVGLNPLVALHFGGGGHNDALMIAFVLGALVLHRQRRDTAAGASWALSALVKWVSLAFLALVALGERRDRGPRVVGWSGLWLVVFGAGATLLYGTAWFSAAHRLSAQARRTGSIGLSAWLQDVGLSHRPIVVAIGLLTLLAAAWLGTQAWRGRVRLGLAGVLLAVLQGWLNPWYALWGLGLAAPEEDRTAQVLAVALSAVLLRDALPI